MKAGADSDFSQWAEVNLHSHSVFAKPTPPRWHCPNVPLLHVDVTHGQEASVQTLLAEICISDSEGVKTFKFHLFHHKRINKPKHQSSDPLVGAVCLFL